MHNKNKKGRRLPHKPRYVHVLQRTRRHRGDGKRRRRRWDLQARKLLCVVRLGKGVPAPAGAKLKDPPTQCERAHAPASTRKEDA
jgi:hypothetical protein